MRSRIAVGLLGAGLLACGAAGDAPRSATQGGEASEARLRIGIPRELREPSTPAAGAAGIPSNDAEASPVAPEASPVTAPPVERARVEPPSAEPSPAEPPPQEGSDAPPSTPSVAGWSYLRDARRHVAHTYRDEIQACFDAGFARGPLAGRLVVAMVPHADGRVAASRVLENGTADPEVGECVAQAARGWALPAPPRRTLEVQLRFTI